MWVNREEGKGEGRRVGDKTDNKNVDMNGRTKKKKQKKKRN